MKYRIIGTLVVFVILAALFVVTQEPSNQGPAQSSQPANDVQFQPLKIN